MKNNGNHLFGCWKTEKKEYELMFSPESLARAKALDKQFKLEAKVRNKDSKLRTKQSTLRDKYDLSFFIEKDYPRLMKILQCVDNGKRLAESEVAWLHLDGDEYFTEKLKIRYHNNEAEFYVSEFKKRNDPWLAVNASSHYRKCGKSQVADVMLSDISLSNLKNTKLKSAIYTTQGGVKRDLKKFDDALILGEKAHNITKKDFRPCTLLGAVHMETGDYELGQKWYALAIKNGFSERAMDSELRSIFMRAKKSDKEALRVHLLKIDPKRYSWAKHKIGSGKKR